MTRRSNLRIKPDGVVTEPIPADFFCTISEDEWADAGERQKLIDGWRRDGIKQMRVTIVNEQYPDSGYPYGVWIEGWLDEKAQMLPFGEAYPDEKGAVYPPLVAA